MIMNVRGDMGFMESMVSLMAVVIVIGLYVVFVASTAISANSPLEELDAELLIEETADGPRISDSYAYMYVFNKGLKGMSITVSAPFFQYAEETDIGEISGAEYCRTFLTLEGYANGRTLPTIVEVRAFA